MIKILRTATLCLRLSCVLLSGLLISCANSPRDVVADTAFPYSLASKDVNQANYPRLMIAEVNFGKPSRKYLRAYESRVDEFVRDQLKEANYQIVSSGLFEDEWDTAVRRFGNPYNPTTGKLNQNAFSRVMRAVFEGLQARNVVDAIVFTDLIEREVSYGNSTNRVARWDGVSRKLATQGPGSGVPQGFNWAQNVEAVSLWINVFDIQLNPLFRSAGGIEVSQALSLKSTPKFVRRRTLLGNRRSIEEGVDIAFHPMILMKNYPGPKEIRIEPAAEPAPQAEAPSEPEAEVETESEIEVKSEIVK